MFCKSTQGGELYKVHKEIESFIGHVPGVTSELTTSGIRVFAGDQMAQQHILNIDGQWCVEVGILKVNHVCFITLQKYSI